MRRLVLSIAGGIVLPVFLYLLYVLVGLAYLGLQLPWLEWLVVTLFYLVFWPLIIWDNIFPAPPTAPALIATAITVFVFWSLLTYLLQHLVAKLSSHRARVWWKDAHNKSLDASGGSVFRN